MQRHPGSLAEIEKGTPACALDVQHPFSEISYPRRGGKMFAPIVVELTTDEVIVRSTRPRCDRYAVKCQRTSDLHTDLDSALAQLVDQLS
jgi:hypothetical protein